MTVSQPVPVSQYIISHEWYQSKTVLLKAIKQAVNTVVPGRHRRQL